MPRCRGRCGLDVCAAASHYRYRCSVDGRSYCNPQIGAPKHYYFSPLAMQTLFLLLIVLCLIATPSIAQQAVTTPRLGFIVDPDRALLDPWAGIAGNFP